MIAIVDYGAGNLGSVRNALAWLGLASRIAGDGAGLEAAGAIIFPGVGAAGPAMAELRRRGLDVAIRDALERGAAYLGICLGLQLLFEASAEDHSRCLGIVPGRVERMEGPGKIPHVGWNTIERVRLHPVLEGLEGRAAYFSHSYAVRPRERGVVAGTTTHGARFVSVIAQGRLVGVQFHPERSGPVGLGVLERFARFAAARAARCC
ncbi:MAG: imidazole glycerol phosphate synthase subunit HisH [Candidatus Dormibacteraceae bacterium]